MADIIPSGLLTDPIYVGTHGNLSYDSRTATVRNGLVGDHLVLADIPAGTTFHRLIVEHTDFNAGRSYRIAIRDIDQNLTYLTESQSLNDTDDDSFLIDGIYVESNSSLVMTFIGTTVVFNGTVTVGFEYEATGY